MPSAAAAGGISSAELVPSCRHRDQQEDTSPETNSQPAWKTDVDTSMTLPGSQTNPQQLHNTAPSNSLDVKSNSPNVSPQSSPRPPSRSQHRRECSTASIKESINEKQEQNELNNFLKPIDQGSIGDLSRSSSQDPVRERKSQDRVKKKTPWYSALYPTYKSRSEDFKRIFKDVPPEERLVVDYSCAIQRDILLHGRLYISQNYLCFYANIFRWETQVVLRWKDVTALTKEKTALVIPNAILVHTDTERHFFTSFAARDKAYLMLFRVWQNVLMDQPMSMQEMWQRVHSCYGEELGLTSDDDDYIAPSNPDDEKQSLSKSDRQSLESFSEESVSVLDQGDISVENRNSPIEMLPGPLSVPRSPSDQLPTDLSDSSPSESESEKQGGIITCPVLHEGKLMLHMQVSIHVDQLFTLLFTNSKFFLDMHETRRSTEIKQSPWVINPSTNQKGRTVSLTVLIGQPVGSRHAQVTEAQKMLPCSKPGEMYAIEIETSNAGVPYAESFYITSHYCLTRGADAGTSTIAVYCQIKYRKSVWGIVKTFIEKNCWSGLEEYYTFLIKALESECERTRRAMAAGVAGTKRKISRRRRSQCLKPLPLPAPIIEEKPLIQPLPLPKHHPVKQNSHSDTLLWVVFTILVALLILNAALYYKLWGLEQFERASTLPNAIDLEILRQSPQNEDDWRKLLQKQEQLHSEEVHRWIRILKAAVHLLQEVEHSLTALQSSIQSVISENTLAEIKETMQPNGDDIPRSSEL